jgi:hypothetical protein
MINPVFQSNNKSLANTSEQMNTRTKPRATLCLCPTGCGRTSPLERNKADRSHESIFDKTGTRAPFRDSARDQHRLAPIASPDPGCLNDFPMPMQTRYEDRHNNEISTVKSSGSEDMGRGAYAHVRKPSAAVSQSREDASLLVGKSDGTSSRLRSDGQYGRGWTARL